jgi:hypothetical protein
MLTIDSGPVGQSGKLLLAPKLCFRTHNQYCPFSTSMHFELGFLFEKRWGLTAIGLLTDPVCLSVSWSVIELICCCPTKAQSFLVSSRVGLLTIFYSLTAMSHANPASVCQSGKLLLGLASTVSLGFRSHQNPLPHFCFFQDFCIFSNGACFYGERMGLTTAVHSLSGGGDSAVHMHTHTHTHTHTHSTHSVCQLGKSLLVHANTVVLGPRSHGTRDHICV